MFGSPVSQGIVSQLVYSSSVENFCLLLLLKMFYPTEMIFREEVSLKAGGKNTLLG